MRRRLVSIIMELFDAHRTHFDIYYAVYRMQEIEPTVSVSDAKDIVIKLIYTDKLILSDGWKLTLPS